MTQYLHSIRVLVALWLILIAFDYPSSRYTLFIFHLPETKISNWRLVDLSYWQKLSVGSILNSSHGFLIYVFVATPLMHPLNLIYATQTMLTQQRCILAFVETTTECSPIMFTADLFTNIYFYIHFITNISVSIIVPLINIQMYAHNTHNKI